MRALFVELPAFARVRARYLDDAAFRAVQSALMLDPHAGDPIVDSGGLRKLRLADRRRGKGTRGGLRLIYFWWPPGRQFWLFTMYGKDEAGDLTAVERRAIRAMLKHELSARRGDVD